MQRITRHPALQIQPLHKIRLLLGTHTRKNILGGNARLLRDAGCRERIVPGKQIRFQPLPLELGHHFGRARF